MKLFCIANQSSGIPAISNLPFAGWLQCGAVANWAAYLFSGKAAQLTAINALSDVYGIVAVTETGNVKWAELDEVISSTARNRLNTWLTNRGYPNIPAGWTFRRVIEAIFKRLNARFDLSTHDVME